MQFILALLTLYSFSSHRLHRSDQPIPTGACFREVSKYDLFDILQTIPLVNKFPTMSFPQTHISKFLVRDGWIALAAENHRFWANSHLCFILRPFVRNLGPYTVTVSFAFRWTPSSEPLIPFLEMGNMQFFSYGHLKVLSPSPRAVGGIVGRCHLYYL